MALEVVGGLGITPEMVHKVLTVADMVSALPSHIGPIPLGPVPAIKAALAPLIPLVEAVRKDANPGSYVRMVPEAALRGFIGNVTQRLEWVMHGEVPTLTTATSEVAAATDAHAPVSSQ